MNDDETGRRANEKLKEVMRIKRELEDCVKLSISLEDLIVGYAEKNEIPNMRMRNLSVSMPDVRMKNSISDLSRPQGRKSKWGSEELSRPKRYRKRFPQEQNYTSSDSYYRSNPLGRKRRSRLSPDSISSSSISDGETYRRNVHKLEYPKNLVPFSPLGLEATSKLVRFKKLTTPTTSSVSSESLPQIGLVVDGSRSSLDSPPPGPPIPVETPSYSSQDISHGNDQEIGLEVIPGGYRQISNDKRRAPRAGNIRTNQVARDDHTSDCLNTLETSDGDGRNNTAHTDSPKVSTVESEIITVEMAVSPIEELRQLPLQRHPTIEYVHRATSPIVEVITRPNKKQVETRAAYTSSYSQTDSKESNAQERDVVQYFTKSSQNSTLETSSIAIPAPSRDSESQTAPPTRSSKGTSTETSIKVSTLGPIKQPAIVKTLSKNSVFASEKSLTTATQTVSSELPAVNLEDVQKYARVAKKRLHRGNYPRTREQPQVLFCRKHMKSSPHKPSKTTYNVNKKRRKPEKQEENQYNTVTYHVNKTPHQPRHPREKISSSTSNNRTGDEGDSTLNFSTNFFTLSPEPGRRDKGWEGDVVSSILLVPNSPDPLKGGEVWEKISGELSPTWSDSCDYVDTTSDPSSMVDRKYMELMRRFSKNTVQEKRLLLNLFEDLGLSEKRCARLLNAIRRTGPMP
ncbi:hypothetical protein ACHWQZ_G002463 [Mnemiopsis leidyi]